MRVNKEQINCLVDAMCTNPSYGRAFQKEKKEDMAKFWNELHTKLNSRGPPTKSVSEWKKVWIDQKRHIRKKLAKNIRNRNKNGGAPHRGYVFSANEEAIIDLLSMEESIEDFEVEVFETPLSSGKRKIVNMENKEQDTVEQDTIKKSCGRSANTETITTHITKKNKMDASVIFSEELETQKKICINIEECKTMCINHYKHIDSNLKSIGTTLQQLVDTQKDILEETKRHNKEMEYLRSLEMQNNMDLTKIKIE